jgi:hypothetical protein
MPNYSLATIHKIAQNEERIFLSRRARTDSLNLGYGMSEVAACIRALKTSDFFNTQNYNGIIMDAYRIFYQGPSGKIDDLYLKLRLTPDNRLAISISSFHLSR